MLQQLKEATIAGGWFGIDLGEGVEMCVCALDPDIEETILAGVEGMLGKQLDIIHMYARYNSPDTDTSFRIHSDGAIGSLEPDYASVLYLTTGETGTAFWEHPEHGLGGAGLIFTEDDGKWQHVGYCQEKENTCCVYNANTFHSRWPAKASDHRFVVVGFYKER